MDQLDLETLRNIATLLSDPASLASTCKYISASITGLGRVHEFAWFSRWYKELCPCRPWQYCALTWTRLKRLSLPELVDWMLQYALWCAAAGTAVKLPRKATAGAHKQLARGNAVAALRLLCPHPEHLLLGYAVTARWQDLVRALIKSSRERELSPMVELPASSKISCAHNTKLTAALVASRCDPHIMLILLASFLRPLKKWERRLLVNHAVELGQPEALMQLDLASTSYGTADLQLRHHHLAKAAARPDAGAAAMVQHLLGALPKKILQPKYLLPVYAAACRFANPHVLAVLISHALAAPAQLQLPASMLCAAAAQGAVLPAPLRLMVHALKTHIAQLSQAGTAGQQQQPPAAAAAAVLGRKRRASGQDLTAAGEAAAAADETGPAAAATGTGKKRRGSPGVVITTRNEAAAGDKAAAGDEAAAANSEAGDMTSATATTAATGNAGDGAAITSGSRPAAAAAAAAALSAPPPSNELGLSPALLARALMHLLGSKAVWKEHLGPGKIRSIPTVQVPSLGHVDFSEVSGLAGFRDVGSDPLLATRWASTSGQLEACQELWEFCGELGSSMQQQMEEVLCGDFKAAGWLGIGPVWGNWGRAGLRWMLRTLPKWKEQHGQLVEQLLQALPEYDVMGEGQEHPAEGGGSEEDGGSREEGDQDGEGAGDSSRGAAGASNGSGHLAGSASHSNEKEKEEREKMAAVAGAQQQQQIQAQQQQELDENSELKEHEEGQQQQQDQMGGKRENQHQQEQLHQGGGEGEAEGQQHEQEGGQQEGYQQHQQSHEQGQQQQEGDQQQEPEHEEGEGDADEDEYALHAKLKFLFDAYMALCELGFVSAAITQDPHVLDKCLSRHLAELFQRLPAGTEIGTIWFSIWQPAVRQCLPRTCAWFLQSLDEADRAQLGLHSESAMRALCPWVAGYAPYAARMWVKGDWVVGGGRDEIGEQTAAPEGGGGSREGEGVPRAKRHAAAATAAVGGAGASNKGSGSVLRNSAFRAAVVAAVPASSMPGGSSTWSSAAAAPATGAVASPPEPTAVAAGGVVAAAAELTHAGRATAAAAASLFSPAAAAGTAALTSHKFIPAGLIAAAESQLQWRSSWVMPVSSSRSWRDALGDVAMTWLEAPWAPPGALSYWLACLTRTYSDTSGVLAVMERVLEELEKGGVEGLPQGAKGFKSMRGLQNVMLRGDMDVLAAVVTWGMRLPMEQDSDEEGGDDDGDGNGAGSDGSESGSDGEAGGE